MKENIGEGIAFLGIMILVAVTKNYWLLFLIILPFCTSGVIDNKARYRYNELIWKKQELENEKLGEEIRLLKTRKR